MKTALVTGGNGFVGSSVIRHLVQDGYEVHATVNKSRDVLDSLLPPSNIHTLSDKFASAAELVSDVAPTAIFHLAAYSSQPTTLPEMSGMLEGNINFGISLLYGATRCPSPPVFLNAGTYWQFSDPTFTTPNSFYAATKQAFHDFLAQFRRTFQLRAVTLVLFDTIGRRDLRPKLWNQLVKTTPGSSVALTGGAQEIELVHVDDVARGFLHASKLLMEEPLLLPEAIYALRSGKAHTLREFLDSLKRRGILDLHFAWGELSYPAGQIFKLWPGKQLPGWTPVIDVSQTIAEMASDQAQSHTFPTNP
jgi:nucleoside-diphosphate-sugar epimerase